MMPIAENPMNNFIGLPWAPNGRGPDSFDCWGLVMAVFQEVRGIELPDWQIDPYTYTGAMKTLNEAVSKTIVDHNAYFVSAPRDFDIAVLVRKKTCFHVGVWYGGGIMHIRGKGSTSTWEKPDTFARCYGGFMRLYRWR